MAGKRDQTSKNYKHRYGLTAIEVGEMVASQGGMCGICGVHFSATGKHRACVDHDHKTKRLRGILCAECNTGIGKFEDSRRRLKAAIDYLTEHS